MSEEEGEMTESRNFARPDLTGETLGGVKLSKRIGSGGFGDVYVSEDHKICVKVVFRDAFAAPESYEREKRAVQCISACLRRHCGIIKFLGGGNGEFDARQPFAPVPMDLTPAKDFRMYRNFPVTPEFWEYECRRQPGDDGSREFFYYLMLAADNLVKKPEYCPDTLENRCRLGRLERMSDKKKLRVLGEIIDSLLFLSRLEVDGREAEGGAIEVFHIAHGDIKPANIFFVDGHALLGDMGATLQIDQEKRPPIGTPDFMLNENERSQLKEKCRDDAFAYSVFSDIYALGLTGRYMMLNGEAEPDVPPDTILSMVVDSLCSFHADPHIHPGNVMKKLKELRKFFTPAPNRSGQRSRGGSPTAPEISLKNLFAFSREWQIFDAESAKRFRVINNGHFWRGRADILLAERYPESQEAEIRQREESIIQRGQDDGRPILIYHLEHTGEFIVLSHGKDPFSASEDALRLLQKEIDEARLSLEP